MNALIRHSSRTVSRYYGDVLEPTGLRSTQFTMLAALAQTGPIPLTKLASLIGVERSALARNLKPLERSGFVSTYTGDDKRVRMAKIRRSGRAKLRKALPYWAKAQSRLAQVLGSGDVTQLVGMLKNVTEKIDTKR